jgi:hypothetical protein
MGDLKKTQLATPEWNDALFYSLTESLGRQVRSAPKDDDFHPILFAANLLVLPNYTSCTAFSL